MPSVAKRVTMHRADVICEADASWRLGEVHLGDH
jgi:hypothetical protein